MSPHLRLPSLLVAASLVPASLALLPDAAAERTAVPWYGTWKGALAEAERSGRPILLLAATPQCHGISGVW